MPAWESMQDPKGEDLLSTRPPGAWVVSHIPPAALELSGQQYAVLRAMAFADESISFRA